MSVNADIVIDDWSMHTDNSRSASIVIALPTFPDIRIAIWHVVLGLVWIDNNRSS